MTPIWGLEEYVVPFVAKVAGERPDFGNCRTMAVLDAEGRMVAGIVFHNWSPERGVLEVSAAAVDPRWATRTVLMEAFGYAFAHAQMVVARTADENHRTRRLWKAFGAEEYILPRLRGREASEAIMLLSDDAWKASSFMRSRNGQVKSSGSAGP